jgi:carnitine monooxygenase subunit
MMELPYKSLDVPEDWDRRGLPGWTYRSEALLELEKENVFLNHWQIVGHVNDIIAPGDWLTFDLLGERAVIMRGTDGVIRAFHNLCRHRGARVVEGETGHCRGSIVCPFHGWVYNLDGTLRGPAQPKTFNTLDRAQFGLKPIELEIFHGFIFIRFKPGPQPNVADAMRPYTADFAAYSAAELLPARAAGWFTDTSINWKSSRDVDNEGYHVPLAHPGLQDLYGRDYRDLYLTDELHMAIGYLNEGPGRTWSVRHYNALTPAGGKLPPHLQRAWTYYGLFPNTVISFTPQEAFYYQDIPLATGKTRQSGRSYRNPHETRLERVTRYLAQRINRDTSAEDQQLSMWSDESMRSSAFDNFHLSDLEWGLRRHHDRLRTLLPVMTLHNPPAEHEITALNTKLTCARPAPR